MAKQKRTAAAAATVTAETPVPVAETTPATTPATTVGATTARKLIEECSKVRCRISWFPTSVKISEEHARRMRQVVGATKRRIAETKRLLVSGTHPLLDECNQARNAIKAYLRSMTLPFLLVATTDTKAEEDARKDAGTRLILKKDMQAFDERVRYLSTLLYQTVARLQEQRSALLEAEREALGPDLFDPEDYPTDFTKEIQVEVIYESTGIDIDWRTHCPEIYRSQVQRMEREASLIIANGAAEFAESLSNYLEQTVRQLGNRRRLNPRPGSGYPAHLQEAEVVREYTHKDLPDQVPEGSVLLQVRYASGARSQMQDVGPVTPAQLQNDLRVYVTTERRQLQTASIEHLRREMERLMNIGPMLGEFQAHLAPGIERIQRLLTDVDAGMNPERIAEQLRSSEYLRNQFTTTLTEVGHLVSDAVEDVVTTRRRVPRVVADM